MLRLSLLCALALAIFALPEAVAQRAACTNGFAQLEGSPTSFACNQVDLMANLSIAQMGGNGSNDIWGWTDPVDGSEYALVGLGNGTSFVNVTDPEAPVFLGRLPGSSSIWRDIKVYADHAYIVSEAGGYGMQVFDLTQLRGMTSPTNFTVTAQYNGVGSSHNIVINEDTGFAYIVGAQGGSQSGCSGGLHMVDLSTPTEPAFAGCFSADGYTHDAQCVVYTGPDADYAGSEICVASNADTVTIVDVTDKSAPVMISQAIYPNVGYTHQGWLTEDQRYFIGDDELDESNFGFNTRTLIFDVQDLDNPEFASSFSHDTPSYDHNLYVKGQYVYQSNYTAGLRILDASALLASGPENGLQSAAFFDTYPNSNGQGFGGSWSNYPYFASGNIIVNDGSRGLFIVRPTFGGTTDAEDATPGTFEITSAYPNPFTSATRLTVRVAETQSVRVELYDVLGRRIAEPFAGALVAGEAREVEVSGAGLPAGSYLLRITGEDFAETRRITLAR